MTGRYSETVRVSAVSGWDRRNLHFRWGASGWEAVAAVAVAELGAACWAGSLVAGGPRGTTEEAGGATSLPNTSQGRHAPASGGASAPHDVAAGGGQRNRSVAEKGSGLKELLKLAADKAARRRDDVAVLLPPLLLLQLGRGLPSSRLSDSWAASLLYRLRWVGEAVMDDVPAGDDWLEGGGMPPASAGLAAGGDRRSVGELRVERELQLPSCMEMLLPKAWAAKLRGSEVIYLPSMQAAAAVGTLAGLMTAVEDMPSCPLLKHRHVAPSHCSAPLPLLTPARSSHSA